MSKLNTENNESILKTGSKEELLRLLAAKKLRALDYEAYAMSDVDSDYLPHVVAAKDEKVYNVYLYENEEEKEELFTGERGEHIFNYAKSKKAFVMGASIKLEIVE